MSDQIIPWKGIDRPDVSPASREWREMKRWCEERLNGLREGNDSPHQTDVETAFRRGQIAMVKEFMALGDPTPEPTSDE